VTDYVTGFDDPACQDPRQFGGKAAGLAGLAAAGLPVAPGFAVSASAYRAFRAGSGMPSAVAFAITSAYQRLCDSLGLRDVPVAVRSSATAEDSAATSFAGEFDTYVDITGAADIIAHVQRCWESLSTPRARSYAHTNGVDPDTLEMAVVIQKMVRATAAGVMFTISPVTGDRSRIAIEASWGLGLAVVGGEVTPDRWIVDKIALSIVECSPGDKRIEYLHGATPSTVEQSRWAAPCLSDDQVVALASLGKRIERGEGRPQDIEFAVEGSEIVLLQRRPETVWSGREYKPRFVPGQGLTRWVSGAVTPRRAA